MNEYIFYTPEGHTVAPNEYEEIENCQILGFAIGFDAKQAQINLLKDNPWILKAGYDRNKIIWRQIV